MFKLTMVPICGALVAMAFSMPTNAAATKLLEFDASIAGAGVTPTDLPDWGSSFSGSPPATPMINTGSFLLQDLTSNPEEEYGEYYSPFLAPGTFTNGGAAYGIEFRVRPIDDLPFVGHAWANLYLTWSDDDFNYNISVDRDGNDGSGPEPNGDIVYGRNSFTPAISNIDWSVPHTIFIGHRGDGGSSVFDFFLDGAIVSTVVDGSIGRDRTGFELFEDSIGFGDGTTAATDLRAEWYFVRVWDVNNPALISGDTADFDGDLDIDGNDFLIWQRNFGRSDPGVSLASGDANNSGNVDGDDLLVWQNQYGNPPLVAASSLIPEPSTIALAILAVGTGLLGSRGRRRA